MMGFDGSKRLLATPLSHSFEQRHEKIYLCQEIVHSQTLCMIAQHLEGIALC